jgi:hypothetical protein
VVPEELAVFRRALKVAHVAQSSTGRLGCLVVSHVQQIDSMLTEIRMLLNRQAELKPSLEAIGFLPKA